MSKKLKPQVAIYLWPQSLTTWLNGEYSKLMELSPYTQQFVSSSGRKSFLVNTLFFPNKEG